MQNGGEHVGEYNAGVLREAFFAIFDLGANLVDDLQTLLEVHVRLIVMVLWNYKVNYYFN